MSAKTSNVLINGKLVGHMSDLEIDTPWARAFFEPTSLFAEYASLFTSLHQAYVENRYDVVNRLNGEVDELYISIEDEGGRLLFASDPNASPVQRISTVRIRKDEISWRPAPS